MPKKSAPAPAGERPYLNARGLADLLMTTTKTVRKWAREGLIPVPVRLSPRKSLWDVKAVRAALARLAEEGGGHE